MGLVTVGQESSTPISEIYVEALKRLGREKR